jgi:hypothetical protein
MPLVQIETPGGVKFTVNDDAAGAFKGFLSDLEQQGYKIDQGQSSGYAPRNIAGTNTPSLHSSGHAIDINSVLNQRGAKTPSDLPANVGDIASKWGLTWGGNWSGDTRDPMHFEFNPAARKTAMAEPYKPSAALQQSLDRPDPAPDKYKPSPALQQSLDQPDPPTTVASNAPATPAFDDSKMIPQPGNRTAPPQPPQTAMDQLTGGLTAVRSAAVKGAADAPTVLTPGAENVATAVGGVPAWLAIHSANYGLQAGAAAYSALQEGVRQVGNPIGKAINGQPGLGDDVATALDIIPATKMERLPAVQGAETVRRGAFRDQLDKMTTAENTAVENAKTAAEYQKTADAALESGARDAEIKQRAYQLWQQDGSKPTADPASYWKQAQDSLKSQPSEPPKTPVTDMQKSGIDWNKIPKDEVPTENAADAGTQKLAQHIIQGAIAAGAFGSLGHFHFGDMGGYLGLAIGPTLSEIRLKYGQKVSRAVGQAVSQTIQQQARNPLGTGGEIERMSNPLPDQSPAPSP